jgi:hypothetical protein
LQTRLAACTGFTQGGWMQMWAAGRHAAC